MREKRKCKYNVENVLKFRRFYSIPFCPNFVVFFVYFTKFLVWSGSGLFAKVILIQRLVYEILE